MVVLTFPEGSNCLGLFRGARTCAHPNFRPGNPRSSMTYEHPMILGFSCSQERLFEIAMTDDIRSDH